MVTTVQAPTQAHPARQKALEPFLERLRGWNATAGGEHDLACKARITVGQRAVILEPWERQQLDLWFHGAGPKSHHLPVLAHGAALMLKAACDIERLIGNGESDATSLYALQAELMLDTAIGMALLKDAQHSIEDLVKDGLTDAAKGLTQFRHRLSRVVSDAKMCIAESEQAQAEAIAPALTDRPDRPQQPAAPASRRAPGVSSAPRRGVSPATASRVNALDEIAEPVAEPAPPVRRRARAVVPDSRPGTRRGPSGTQVLLLMCLASFVVWMAFVQAPRYLAQEAAVMTRAQFREGLPITGVESRAPSVYVSMSQGAWNAMDDRGQLAFVQELGRSAAREGQTGLFLRSEAGVPLGHWLAQRGASVIVDREGATAPALPQAPAPPAEAEQVPPVTMPETLEIPEILEAPGITEEPAGEPLPPAGAVD